MAGDLPHISTCRVTVTNVDVNDIVTLPMGNPNRNVILWGHRFDVTGGSAATYRIYIGETATFVAADINTVYSMTAAVAVATITHTMFGPLGIPARTDASGNLYAQFGFDAAADNDGTYLLYYETVFGS